MYRPAEPVDWCQCCQRGGCPECQRSPKLSKYDHGKFSKGIPKGGSGRNVGCCVSNPLPPWAIFDFFESIVQFFWFGADGRGPVCYQNRLLCHPFGQQKECTPRFATYCSPVGRQTKAVVLAGRETVKRMPSVPVSQPLSTLP